MLLFLIAVTIITTVSFAAPPTIGPYKSNQKKYAVEAMDSTNKNVWVLYPETSDPNEKFPLISYLHGW